jgi:hypothetical protein
VQCSAMHCSAVQYSAVQCSAVQCSAVQYSAVHCKVTAIFTENNSVRLNITKPEYMVKSLRSLLSFRATGTETEFVELV